MFSYSGRTKAKIQSYLIPPIITASLLLLMMGIRGVYPFGNNEVGYLDRMHQVVPVYCLLWDFLHGESSLFYNLSIGLGTDLTAMTSAFSMFSPFNLLLYLVPRDSILAIIPIATIVKCLCMSFSMYFLFNHSKLFGSTQASLKMLFSVMYALCGYTFLYALNYNPWLDMLVFFPILVLAYLKMLVSGKKIFFSIMVAVCLIVNCELGLMAIIYILIFTGVYIFFGIKMGKDIPLKLRLSIYGKTSGNVLIGIASGMGIASFVIIPYITMMFRRWGIVEHNMIYKYIMLIFSEPQNAFPSGLQRLIMIYGTAFAFALSIVGPIKYNKEPGNTKIFSAMNLIMLLPLLFDSIIVVWNLGEDNCGQLRFGFLIAFNFIMSGCYFAGKPMERNNTEERFKFDFIPLERLVYLLAGIVACGIIAYIYNKIHIDTEIAAFIAYTVVFVVFLIFDIGICLNNKGFFKAKYCYIAVAVEIFFALYGFVGTQQFINREIGQSYNYVSNAKALRDEFNIITTVRNRVKNEDSSLGPNYSMIMQCSSISENFDSFKEESYSADLWGYSVNKDGAFDVGGTVFSDAILNVTKVISTRQLDEKLYEKVKYVNGYYLYEPVYKLPFGLAIDSKTLNDSEWNDVVEESNTLFGSLIGKSEGIASYIDFKNDGNDFYIYTEKKQAIYLQKNSSYKCTVLINDEMIDIPSYGELDNTIYPTMYNNGLLYLGTYEDENIKISVRGENSQKDCKFVGIDLRRLNTLCNIIESNPMVAATDVTTQLGNTITVKLNRYKNRDVLVVPVTYSKNWNIEVNGKRTEPINIGNGMFIGVKLDSENNTIKMTYIPQGFTLGVLITIFCIIILTFILSVNVFDNNKSYDRLKIVGHISFVILWVVLVSLVILLPILATVIRYFI